MQSPHEGFPEVALCRADDLTSSNARSDDFNRQLTVCPRTLQPYVDPALSRGEET